MLNNNAFMANLCRRKQCNVGGPSCKLPEAALKKTTSLIMAFFIRVVWLYK
jgi:hypothetical protein